jgi:carbon storage regulator CsrA
MLVLARKSNEQIIIGDTIRITVLETRGTEVLLAVEAPAEDLIRIGRLLADPSVDGGALKIQ